MGIIDSLDRKPAAGKTSVRMYSGAKASRLTDGWVTSDSSADTELVNSLTVLRARSRQLVRDAPFAKRAKTLVQNNVIGTGIGLQAQVKTAQGKLNKRINDDIEDAFKRWSKAENCHIAGVLNFAAMERMAMGQIFEAGEVLFRKHYTAPGRSRVPYTLELIEPERLANDITVPGPLANGATVRMGVEVDRHYRPLAYWVRELHPGETRFNHYSDRLERIPADQIIHLYVVDRWPQTRGEPWMHATVRKLNDVDGYTEAEIIAARAGASYMGIIETPEETVGVPNTVAGSATGQEITIEPGLMKRLEPGEKFNAYAPNRPNSGAEPFLRFMLREVAAGTGVSYESLSRDYSQSNYSSSRLALLDDRELWRIIQLWFIGAFREKVHSDWMQQAVLSREIETIRVDEYAINPDKFTKAHYKPRGWSWIDPTKEVQAYKEAVKAGFTTNTTVVAMTGDGRDIEDILEERAAELEMMQEKGLKFDTEFQEPKPAAPPGDSPPPPDDAEQDEEQQNPPKRVFLFPQ